MHPIPVPCVGIEEDNQDGELVFQPVGTMPFRPPHDPSAAWADLGEIRGSRLDLKRDQPARRAAIDDRLDDSVDAAIGLMLLAEYPAQLFEDQPSHTMYAKASDQIRVDAHGSNLARSHDKAFLTELLNLTDLLGCAPLRAWCQALSQPSTASANSDGRASCT